MHDHITAAIGTPDLVRLDAGLVCLRFETMKIVSAVAAVQQLLDEGVVRPGDTVVDSSSGIYAYALALACHRFGLHCHIVGSTTVDDTLRVQLAVLGARLEQMPPSESLKLDQSRRVRRVEQLLRQSPDWHWMRQYHDQIHYAGYRAVAEQIAASLGGVGLTLAGGVGSGASTGGLATALRDLGVDVRLVGVQPFGSVTFGSQHLSDPEIIIAGIGSSIPFGNVRPELYDTLHWMAFRVALAGSIDLLRRHAVFAGLSTGAAYLAALEERRRRPGRTALFIAADTGHRYVDSVFRRHAEAADVTQLSPFEPAGLRQLRLPWSRMPWTTQRPQQPQPASAAVSLPAPEQLPRTPLTR